MIEVVPIVIPLLWMLLDTAFTTALLPPLLPALPDVPTLDALAAGGADLHALHAGRGREGYNLLDCLMYLACDASTPLMPRTQLRAVVDWCYAHGIREGVPETTGRIRSLLH